MALRIILLCALLQVVQYSLAGKHNASSTVVNITSVKRNSKPIQKPALPGTTERTRSTLQERLKASGANNATRSMNLESFIANHKEAIVRLLKGIILPKLKARAMQSSAVEHDQYRNLDREAMNYELGYFLGLQKAFRKNPFIGGEQGNQNLIPLKIGRKRLGLAQAKSKGEPMTGYTSVTVPFHKILSTPVHESFNTLLGRYGVKDPGFLKQLTKATDGNDILDFAGKHNLDVFAERKNLEGISEYLSRRSFKKPKKITKDKRAKIPKKDDVMSGIPTIIANDPEVKKYEPLAEVSSGPNPLENDPVPIEKTVTKADNISPTELEGIVKGANGKVNWDEISGIIAKGREYNNNPDDTPEVGRVYQDHSQNEEKHYSEGDVEGRERETEDQRENMEPNEEQSENMESEDNVENMESEDQRENIEPEREEQSENSEENENEHPQMEKRNFASRPTIANFKEYEKDRSELKQVIKEIIHKLSEIPQASTLERRNRINSIPYYYKRNIVPHLFRPFVYPVKNFFRYHPGATNWKRSTIIPRPMPTFRYYRRSETPQEYKISTKAVKGEQQNEDAYPLTMPRATYVNVPGSSNADADAYAYDPDQQKPRPGIESYVAQPMAESYQQALALLNRGSSIENTLGDNLQQSFLQKFLLPSSPSLYKRFLYAKKGRIPLILRPVRFKRSSLNSKSKRKLHKIHHSHVQSKAEIPKAPSMHKTSKAIKKTKVKKSSRKSKKHSTKASTTAVNGAKKQSIPLMSDIGSMVSPALFEKSEENFFSKGGNKIATLPYVSMANSVVQGDSRSLSSTKGLNIKDANHLSALSSPVIEQYGTLQQVSSPGNEYETNTFHKGRPQNADVRSQFVGDRHVSPAIDIYKDHVVTAGGDSPVMEVKSVAGGILNDNGVETQGQGSIETGGKVEVIKSPSTGDEMEAGNFVPPSEQYNLGDANQGFSSASAEHQYGYNQYRAEDVSGDAKQAISNTIASLDKGIAGQGRELEACCTADQNAPCCNPDANALNGEQNNKLNQAALEKAAAGLTVANSDNADANAGAIALNKMADDKLMHDMNSMSKNLDTELLGSIHNGIVNREANHVYLPDEDFDGIDWQIEHQPKTGPQPYNARNSKDIQMLSDPFFQPGIGHQMQSQSGVSTSLPNPSAAGNLPNVPSESDSGRRIDIKPGSAAVTDAVNAGSVIQNVDALNAAKVLSPATSVSSVSGVTNVVAQNEMPATLATATANGKNTAKVAEVQNAVNTAVNAINNVKQVAATSGAAVAKPTKAAAGGGINNAKVTEAIQNALNAIQKAKETAAEADNNLGNQQISTDSANHNMAAQDLLAHHKAVHQLQKDISSNAEQSAIGMNNKISNKIQNVATTHYISDIKNAAAAKIASNNEHAAQLHQMANDVTSANNQVTAQANTLLGNAQKVAGMELHLAGTQQGVPTTTGVVNNIASTLMNAPKPVSSVISSTMLPGPYNSSLNIASHAIDEIEADANRVEDLHHNALHMGTYLIPESLHSVNPAVIGGVLSHDHVSEELMTPVVHHSGNIHLFGQHDSMPIDVSPMTPGGIHFTSSIAGEGGTTIAGTGINAGPAGASSSVAAGQAAGASAGGAAGQAAGASAGGAAGQAAGAGSSGATGQAAGASAGAAAGQAAGAKAGAAAGQASAAGASVGAGQAAGASAGGAAGQAAGASAGGAAGQTAGAATASATGSSSSSSGSSGGTAGDSLADAGKSSSEKIGKTGGKMSSGSSKTDSSKTTSRTSINGTSHITEQNITVPIQTVIEESKKRNVTTGEENFNDGKEKQSSKDNKEKGEQVKDAEVKLKHRYNLNGNNETSVELSDSKVNFQENFDNGTFKTSDDSEPQSLNVEDEKHFTTNQSSLGPQEIMEDAEQGEKSSFQESVTPSDSSVGSSNTTSSLNEPEGDLSSTQSDASSFNNDANDATNDATNNENSEDFNNDAEQEDTTNTDATNNDESSASTDSYQYSDADSNDAGNKKSVPSTDSGVVSKFKVDNGGSDKNDETIPKESADLVNFKSDAEFHDNPSTDENENDSPRNGKTEHESRKLVIKNFNQVGSKNRAKLRNNLKHPRGKRLRNRRKHQIKELNSNSLGHKKHITGLYGKSGKQGMNAQRKGSLNRNTNSGEAKGAFGSGLPRNITDSKLRNSSEFFLIKTSNVSDTSDQEVHETQEQEHDQPPEVTGKNEFFLPMKENEIVNDFKLSDSATEHLLPEDRKKLENIRRLLSIAQLKSLRRESPVQETALTRMLKPLRKVALRKMPASNKIKENDSTDYADYKSLISKALDQIEGIKKTISQPKEGGVKDTAKRQKYKQTIHEALAEISGIRKSLMQPGTPQKLLATALAVSNLANLLKQSTRLFNSLNSNPKSEAVRAQSVASFSPKTGGNGEQSAMLPGSNVAASIVTGNLLMPGAGGALLNPAAGIMPVIHETPHITESSDIVAAKEKSRDKVIKSTKDIYAEIGSSAVDSIEPADTSSEHHSNKKTKE